MLYSTPTPDPFRKTKRKQNRRFSGAVTLPSHMSALRSQLIRWHFIENVKPKVRAKFIQTVVSLSTRFNKIRKTFLTHFFLLFCVSHSHAGFLIFNSSRFFSTGTTSFPFIRSDNSNSLTLNFYCVFAKGNFAYWINWKYNQTDSAWRSSFDVPDKRREEMKNAFSVKNEKSSLLLSSNNEHSPTHVF